MCRMKCNTRIMLAVGEIAFFLKNVVSQGEDCLNSSKIEVLWVLSNIHSGSETVSLTPICEDREYKLGKRKLVGRE